MVRGIMEECSEREEAQKPGWMLGGSVCRDVLSTCDLGYLSTERAPLRQWKHH